jgi:hypothetical protein
MLTVLSNQEGIVHVEYAADGQTVIKGNCWSGTGDKRNVMMQLLAIPKSQLQDNGRAAGTRVWCSKGTTLKMIRSATP